MGTPVAGSRCGVAARAAAVRLTLRDLSLVIFHANLAYALVRIAEFSRNSLNAFVHHTAGRTSGTPQRHPIFRLKAAWIMTLLRSTSSPLMEERTDPVTYCVGYQVVRYAPDTTFCGVLAWSQVIPRPRRSGPGLVMGRRSTRMGICSRS